MQKEHYGYVKTNDGDFYVQIPDEHAPSGVWIFGEYESWEGTSFPNLRELEPVSEEDVPRHVRADLGYLLVH